MPEAPVPGDKPTLYCTPDQVRTAMSMGAEPDPATGSVQDDTQLGDAISDAMTEVDAKVGASGYSVPFADGEVPPAVVSITRDIAAWLSTLTARRGLPLEPTDPVQLRYNRAQGLLDGIQSGTVTLDIAVPGEPEPARGVLRVNNPEGDVRFYNLDDVGLAETPAGRVEPIGGWGRWGRGGW